MQLHILLIVCSVLSYINAVHGQPPKKDKGKVLKKDLPLIGCDVCEMMIKNLYNAVADRRENAPYKKIDEEMIQEEIDGICKPKDKKGTWIRELDIIENDDRSLSLVKPGSYSKCEHECKTIVKSCEDLLDEEIDRDDLGAALWKNKLKQNELMKLTCSDWSERCNSNGNKPKMSSKRNRKDYEFKEIDEKALEMEHLMESMQGMGMGGMNMMDRESMMDMYGGGEGMGGYGGMDPYGGGMDPYAGMNMEDMDRMAEEMGGMDGMGGMGMDPGMMGGDGADVEL